MKGKLNLEELQHSHEAGTIDTVIVGFTDHYGRLMGKRFTTDFFLEQVARAGTHACDYLLTTDMEMEPVAGYDFANWQKGYGDFHLAPDLSTLRWASWLEKTALVICDVVNEAQHQKVSVAPRTVLQQQIQRLAEMGFSTQMASELEYYLFETSYRAANEQGYQQLKPVGWYLEDYHIMQASRTESFTARARQHLQQSGVPVENSKGEWGLGQHELNIRYAPALEMADRHIVYKQCLKELADQMGLSVTFMAKYAEDQAGSSCHLHLSLWSEGQNVFVGTEQFGSVSASKVFGWFLAGCLRYAGEVMPFFAPTVNSYKRFQDASWAPTRLGWSYDNRTAGFRVVGSGDSLRLECRIPGADCNPYLAYAALLACGMQGIKDQLQLPEMLSGDVYSAGHLPLVPQNMRAAVAEFSQSEFAKAAFGGEVVKHYAHFFEQEIQSYEKAVTDWERVRYFERI